MMSSSEFYMDKHFILLAGFSCSWSKRELEAEVASGWV